MWELLRSLFGPPNPTRKWVENPMVARAVELDRHAFCGVAAGEPFDGLSFLGRSRIHPHIHTWHEYPHEGLRVDVKEGAVESFIFTLTRDEDDDLTPYAGLLRYRGSALALHRIATHEGVVSTFGEPWWREDDEEDVTLFYEFGGKFEWRFEGASDGRMCLMFVGRPILADPWERESYGVTKPWPPS